MYSQISEIGCIEWVRLVEIPRDQLPLSAGVGTRPLSSTVATAACDAQRRVI